MSAPVKAQYYSPSQPYFRNSRNGVAVEQLPPPGPKIDENGDYVPAPPRAARFRAVRYRERPQWLPGYSRIRTSR